MSKIARREYEDQSDQVDRIVNIFLAGGSVTWVFENLRRAQETMPDLQERLQHARASIEKRRIWTESSNLWFTSVQLDPGPMLAGRQSVVVFHYSAVFAEGVWSRCREWERWSGLSQRYLPEGFK